VLDLLQYSRQDQAPPRYKEARDSHLMNRVGQNRIYTYIYTVHLVISKPKIPYVHRIYMVLANPTNERHVRPHHHQTGKRKGATGAASRAGARA
jgi:hypothetical protein